MKTAKCLKRIVITSFALLILLNLGGCAKTKQNTLDTGMKTMTTQELQLLFAEKRTAKVHDIMNDEWYTVTYLPDRSFNIAYEGGKEVSGTYSIGDDRFRSKTDLWHGTHVCSSWSKINYHTYKLYSVNGSLLSVVSIQ